MYTDEALAVKLSSNHATLIVGIVVYLTGELINLYHHAVLANLRPAGTSSGYLIPQAGLFHFVVCAHYFGWVLQLLQVLKNNACFVKCF